MSKNSNNMYLSKFFPFLEWLPELKNRNILRADLIAGLTVALVLIPQSMAYAQLAGLPPYYGLYAAFMPPMIAALFGSSRQLATGPVAVVSLMTAAALEPIATAGGGAYIAYAVLLTLMVGIFQISLGLLRLGVMVNFLAHPVVVGFTNAAAIIIATSQLGKIFGVSVEKMPHHYETVWNTILAAVYHIHWPSFAIAILAFAIMITLKRVNPRLPGVLIAVVVTTLLAWATDFQKLETITPEQVASKSIISVLEKTEELKATVDDISETIITTEKGLEETTNLSGPNSLAALDIRHELENLRLERKKFTTIAKNTLKKVRETDLYVIRDGEQRNYYIVEDLPETAKHEGTIWHVKNTNSDGTIELHSGGDVVGQIPQGLPSFSIPDFDFKVILQLLAVAIAISLIGFMEAISIAKAMAAKTRQRLDANQELVGQGLGNIVGSLFQSYPTSGSFSRSAVNISAGAVTGFSSVVTGIVVIITLLWFTPLLYNLPQATLAAVIMMAVIGLVNIKAVKHAWQASRHDGIVSIITFILTLAFAPHLDTGIMMGVGLSLILYLYRTMEPRVAFLSRHSDGTMRDAETFDLECCDNIAMLRFEGTLYFANTSYFEDKVQEVISRKPDMKYLIVDGVSINEMDATGEEMIRELDRRLSDAGIEVLFTRIKQPILDMLKNTHFLTNEKEAIFFRRPDDAIAYAWEALGDNHADDCPLNARRIAKEPLTPVTDQ